MQTHGWTPGLSVNVDGTTDRITGNANITYDGNGNMTKMPWETTSATLQYKADNRLKKVRPPSAYGYQQYGYSAFGQRVWRQTWDTGTSTMTGKIYFCGIDGKLIEESNTIVQSQNGRSGLRPARLCCNYGSNILDLMDYF